MVRRCELCGGIAPDNSEYEIGHTTECPNNKSGDY